jgi:hypothetical protein
MTVDRIVNMVMRSFIRRFINLGVNKGIGLMSPKGEGARPAPKGQGGPDTRAAGKRAKQALRVARRLGR